MALHQAAPQKPGTLAVLPAGGEQEFLRDFHGASLRKNSSRIVQPHKLRTHKWRAPKSLADISAFPYGECVRSPWDDASRRPRPDTQGGLARMNAIPGNKTVAEFHWSSQLTNRLFFEHYVFIVWTRHRVRDEQFEVRFA
jgi:hypothetical protein